MTRENEELKTGAAGGAQGSDAAGATPEVDDAFDESGPMPEGVPGDTRARACEGVAGAKPSTLDRSIARFIDILVALLLAKLPGYVGFFAGLTYVGIADGLMSGRSIGKRLIGLKVIYKDGRQADFRASILRNSTMGVLYMLSHIPIVGWALAAAGLALETLLIIGSDEGRRLGDEVAGTVVVECARPGGPART